MECFKDVLLPMLLSSIQEKKIMKTILLHPQRFRHGDTGIPGSVRSRVRTFKLQTLLAPGKINIDSRKFLATYVVTYQVKLVAK